MLLREVIAGLSDCKCRIVKAKNTEIEIKDIRFLSPIEEELKDETLYVTGLYNWHPEGKQGNHSISILYMGEDVSEYTWADNIICMRDCLENRKYFNEFQKHFFNEADELRMIYRLSDAIIQNRGLQEFLNRASEIIGNPMIILDNNLYCKAVSVQSYMKEWRQQGNAGEIQNLRSNLIDDIKMAVARAETGDAGKSDEFAHFLYSSSLERNIMTQKIRVNNFGMATIVIIEKDTNLMACRIEVCKVLTGLIAQELQKVTYYMDNNGDTKASFLIELLGDLYPSRKLLEKKLERLDYQLKENLYVVVVRFSRKYVDNAGVLLYQFQRVLTGELYAIYQNQLIILVNRNKNEEIGDYFLNTFRAAGLAHHLLIGISREFHDILDIRRFYEQAIKALDYGEVLANRNQKHPLYFFRDYMLMEMLEICRKNANLIDFCNPKLIRLLNYDKEKGTDYMSTLLEFVEHNMNVKKTADILFIHKNTLIYRIEKIKSIMNESFESSWDIFTVYLSFRILMFLDIFKPAGKIKLEEEMKKKLN